MNTTTPRDRTSAGTDNLHGTLCADFEQVAGELATARHRLRSKDTPAHRAAVAELDRRFDGLLDMYLDARRHEGQ